MLGLVEALRVTFSGKAIGETAIYGATATPHKRNWKEACTAWFAQLPGNRGRGMGVYGRNREPKLFDVAPRTQLALKPPGRD